MKRYLIIGASSGIGAALTQSLISEGHHIIGTHNKTLPAFQHDNLKWVQLDVTASDIDLSFIPDQLDGLAYCPGSINLKPFSRLKPEAFIEDYKLNVIGYTQILQAAIPSLKNNGPGAVVAFSTVAVQNGFPFHAQVSASKGAIEGLTKSLAAELAPSIRVNAIAPSLTQTRLADKLLSSEDKIENNNNRHPLKRIGQAEDIAAMAAFLLSDKASWISGQIMRVDGGMSSIRG
ncbi:MAG: SDR family oxidoreductase [Saprospiraceae bacterium]|nr:SDR family oxidoreductase [Saprospiraceae bacterium]